MKTNRNIIKKLVNLEANLDQILFQKQPFLTGGKFRAEDETRGEYAARTAKGVAGGAVVIGTGSAARHVLREHYGAAQGGYKEAGRNAARDVGERAKSAGRSTRSFVSDAGKEIGKGYRQGERKGLKAGASATGAIKKGLGEAAGAAKKVGKKLFRKSAKLNTINLSSPLARRLVRLSDRMEQIGM